MYALTQKRIGTAFGGVQHRGITVFGKGTSYFLEHVYFYINNIKLHIFMYFFFSFFFFLFFFFSFLFFFLREHCFIKAISVDRRRSSTPIVIYGACSVM